MTATALAPTDAAPGRAARPRVIAHRGNSSVAPQNTLAAFEAAWRAGAHSIEIDVQLTADGEPVVIHDDTVDATTSGSGTVARLDRAAIRALDAGSWFSPAFGGQRVPTFAEVVDLLVRRPGMDLLLELKGSWTVEQVRRVTGPIRFAGIADRVVAQSFWPETVAALREADPGLRRGLLVVSLDDDVLARCAELDVVTCNPMGALLLEDPGLVQRLHDAGLEVAVWTLNEPAHWAAADVSPGSAHDDGRDDVGHARPGRGRPEAEPDRRDDVAQVAERAAIPPRPRGEERVDVRRAVVLGAPRPRAAPRPDAAQQHARDGVGEHGRVPRRRDAAGHRAQHVPQERPRPDGEPRLERAGHHVPARQAAAARWCARLVVAGGCGHGVGRLVRDADRHQDDPVEAVGRRDELRDGA